MRIPLISKKSKQSKAEKKEPRQRARPFLVGVRLNQTEKEALEKVAGKNSLASYLRAVGLKGTQAETVILSADDKRALYELIKEINAIGNNLNQIARVLNVEALSIRDSSITKEELTEYVTEIKDNQSMILRLITEYLKGRNGA